MSGVTQLPQINGGVDSVTGVGTALVGGAALTGAVNLVTTSVGQTAVVLPLKGDYPSQPIVVQVITATAGLVFPPSASIAINQGSAGASFSVAQGKTAWFQQVSATQIIATLSA